MINGTTGSAIRVGGTYHCDAHPSQVTTLIEGDTFPKCAVNNHETTWTLAEKEANEEPAATKEAKKSSDEIKPAPASEIDKEAIYKRKGFFAALDFHGHEQPVQSSDLASVIATEKNRLEENLKALEEIHNEKLAHLNARKAELDQMIADKSEIMNEFKDNLVKIDQEYEKTVQEISQSYEQLRTEIKNLGSDKKGMIQKRIEEFEAEINKIVSVYQNLETTQNKKLKQDFDNKNLNQKDKQFYYDYREKLEKRYKEVELRLGNLERSGINFTVANFLIYTGWVATVITSWFFVVWFEGINSESNNIVVHILDGIGNFTRRFGFVMSLLVFLGYIIVVMGVARFCYKFAIKNGFVKDRRKVESAPADENIELNFDKDGILKTQFNAGSWYEMWLKIAPFLAMIFLLVIALAFDMKTSFSAMSNSHFYQVIGILLPVAVTPVIYLYITKIIEVRASAAEENDPPKKHWELAVVVVLFILLVALLFLRYKGIDEHAIGAWGFFIGCLCTGFALSYGYRYISLKETHNEIFDNIHLITRYIEHKFYPTEMQYLKNGIKIQQLYYSLLELVNSRNELGVDLLDPHYQIKIDKYKELLERERGKEAENKTAADLPPEEESASDEKKQQGQTNIFLKIRDAVYDFIKAQEIKFKDKIKKKDKKISELEKQVTASRKDNVEIEELIYFPETAAKIRQYKMTIEQLEEKAAKLKAELDGRYKNDNTYGAINQQIAEIANSKEELMQQRDAIQQEFRKAQSSNEILAEQIKVWISEGYNVGAWYAKHNRQPLKNSSNGYISSNEAQQLA